MYVNLENCLGQINNYHKRNCAFSTPDVVYLLFFKSADNMMQTMNKLLGSKTCNFPIVDLAGD